MSKPTRFTRDKWTAPPTQYDRDKLEEQENHEDLESDTHLDDEE